MKQYLDLVRDILENGERKADRTGTGTRSLFGTQTRYDLRKGFPLLTTKKVLFSAVVRELLWFLKGSTNIHDDLTQHTPIWMPGPMKTANWGPFMATSGATGVALALTKFKMPSTPSSVTRTAGASSFPLGTLPTYPTCGCPPATPFSNLG